MVKKKSPSQSRKGPNSTINYSKNDSKILVKLLDNLKTKLRQEEQFYRNDFLNIVNQVSQYQLQYGIHEINELLIQVIEYIFEVCNRFSIELNPDFKKQFWECMRLFQYQDATEERGINEI